MTQSPRRRSPPGRIAVATRLGDVALRERLAIEVARTPDLVWGDEVADVLIADGAWSAQSGAAGPVVLIATADPAALSPAVRALLPPDASPRTIISAARLVAEGLLILPDSALERLAAERALEEDSTAAPAIALTPREMEVLELLAAGASNKAIARQLKVSVHTVKFHVASLLRKLSADGRLEAVGVGLKAGLLML